MSCDLKLKTRQDMVQSYQVLDGKSLHFRTQPYECMFCLSPLHAIFGIRVTLWDFCVQDSYIWIYSISIEFNNDELNKSSSNQVHLGKCTSELYEPIRDWTSKFQWTRSVIVHWNWIVRCVLLLLVDLNYKISIFIQSAIGIYE